MRPLFHSSVQSVITRCGGTLTTELYKNTGVLLHFQSHVDIGYKKGLVNKIVNRVYHLSSTKEDAKKYNKLCTMFSKLRYLKTLVNSTINKFSQEPAGKIHTMLLADPSIYIVLPVYRSVISQSCIQRYLFSLSQARCQSNACLYKLKTATN